MSDSSHDANSKIPENWTGKDLLLNMRLKTLIKICAVLISVGSVIFAAGVQLGGGSILPSSKEPSETWEYEAFGHLQDDLYKLQDWLNSKNVSPSDVKSGTGGSSNNTHHVWARNGNRTGGYWKIEEDVRPNKEMIKKGLEQESILVIGWSTNNIRYLKWIPNP